MKIFQVVPYYPPHMGGMELYVQHLSEELVKMGHEVTVFTSSNTAIPTFSKVNGVKINSLKAVAKIYNVPIVPSLFWKLLSEEKPDIIHAHQYPVFLSDMSAFVSRLKGIPLIVHVHVISDAKSAASGCISKVYYSTVGLQTLHSANVVVVPSLAYKSKIVDMQVNPGRVRVVHYGIEVERFESGSSEAFRARYNLQGSKVILSVGRLNYQKGFQFLIKSMPHVLGQIPNAKLIIVGEGEQLAELKRLSQELGVESSVIFTGLLTQQEIPDAYSAADVFVMPSLFESFGISLIEAQSAKKPVIGSKTGGVPEVLVDGKTGFLVEPGNIKELATRVIQVLSDRGAAEEMGLQGNEFVKSRYSIQTSVFQIIKTYKETLSAIN